MRGVVLLAVAMLGLILLSSVAFAAYDVFLGTSLSRRMLLNGCFAAKVSVNDGIVEFKERGVINLKVNSVVEFCVENVDRKAHIFIECKRDGHCGVIINDLPIKEFKVNGEKVAEDDVIVDATFWIWFDTIESTLTVKVTKDRDGVTRLVVNGTTVIDGRSRDEIVVTNVKPAKTGKLEVYLGSVWRSPKYRERFVEGVTEKVLVNGEEVLEVTVLAPLIASGLAATIIAVSRCARRGG